MDKQINVNMRFNADIAEAQRNINNLNKALEQVRSFSFSGNKITPDLQSASESAKELQKHLANAFNFNTGNLNLSKLNDSLKQSNTSLGQLGNNLLKAGLEGESAFISIQNAVSTAAVKIKQTNGFLNKFLETMQNTLRYEISTKIWYALAGAISSAYNYAQDLNKSLNNIRIVSGQSSEQMAKFAEQANKAAKALSSSTLDYTNAALIFAQQGNVKIR